ncbi:D-TA family PLP-dependent enzyme [Stieleria sp. JC731]|uniref:D-TA family PLP-dependent enzyme n=1 Tax=Pirellulaceae TaxID=2691357 RepID=UPI001E54EDD4|nr:D-TA family PLP-dependent enzyme [Stieleria sp. JC731]MCC9600807.1 D-TA family PLP-dependent enzyme [Stieleria sp. JC731]
MRWFEIDNVDEVPSPSLLIDVDRVKRNIQRMIQWCGDRGPGVLRPHVKTHKLPQIIDLKRQAGIDKFKTSTIAECEMTAEAGGTDILLAYQPVGPNLDRLLTLIERFDHSRFSTIVDCPEIAQQLAQQAHLRNLVVDVYVDLNVGMDRTGIRIGDSAEQLYRFIQESESLNAVGLHAYDGHIHHTDTSTVVKLMDEAFEPVWQWIDSIRQRGLVVPKVVGCGTPTSELMLQRSVDFDIEVSAGTSVLWDAGQPTFSPPMEFENAALVLGRVISRPTEQTLCIDVGHKSVGSEMQPPRIIFQGLEDASFVMQSEEHLVLKTERAQQYGIGHVFYGAPIHVCPTVALYDHAWCVKDGKAIERWPIVARARRITI